MESHFVQTPLVRLQYLEHGTGPEVLVLVHGYQASARIWRLTQEALDPARFRSIAINNRGAGDSDRSPNEADYSIESFAADLYAAIETLGLRNITLVGHSLGGKIVTRYALDHPETLKALVLLDSRMTGTTLPDGWEEAVRQRFHRGAMVPDVPWADTPKVPEDFRQALAADIARTPLERMIGSLRSSAMTQLGDRLPELRMPVLIAAGDKDQSEIIEDSLAAFMVLPRERRSLHIFHGAGHGTNVEMSLECASVLDRFVTRTVPTAVATAVG
jgi:pimeloyl-ACP methyl ester carboxylesterase